MKADIVLSGAAPLPQRQGSQLWRAVFRMPLIDWVSDFLFATDGTTNASMLLSPLQATHAQLMSTVASYGGAEGVSGDAISSHWLLLPAFSVAGVSAGLVVVEDTAAPPRLMRYVRCDDTGDTLLVGDASDGLVFEVEFVSYDSPRRSTRAYCQFSGELREHLRSRKGGFYVDDATVRRCLMSSLVLQETRASCAVCEEKGTCACRFSFRRARHPLDFAYTAPNALPLLGDFRGVGRTITFHFGRILQTSTITTELRTRGGGEVGCTERLRFWAAQYCLGQGKPNPMMLEMPAAEKEAMVDLFLNTDDVEEKGTEPKLADAEVPSIKMECSTENGTASGAGEDISSPGTGVSMKLENAESEACNASVLTANGLKDIADEGNAKVSVMPIVTVPDGSVPILASSPQPSTATAPISLIRPPHPVPSMPRTVYGAPVVPPTMLGYHAPAMHAAQVPAGPLPQKRGWIAIAPSADVQPSVEQYSSAERRKILKREAAARSNAKRREVVALQRKLTKARGKVEALRKREQELRDENTQLRARANAENG